MLPRQSRICQRQHVAHTEIPIELVQVWRAIAAVNRGAHRHPVGKAFQQRNLRTERSLRPFGKSTRGWIAGWNRCPVLVTAVVAPGVDASPNRQQPARRKKVRVLCEEAETVLSPSCIHQGALCSKVTICFRAVPPRVHRLKSGGYLVFLEEESRPRSHESNLLRRALLHIRQGFRAPVQRDRRKRLVINFSKPV